jgi:hypothetical protein
MELGIAVAVGCAVVLWALFRGGSDPSRSIVDMWRFRPPEWPTGVQEDDDLHWSWMAHRESRGPEPEVVDGVTGADAEVIDSPSIAGGGGGSLRVDVQRVTYEVRSADRARS